MTRILAIALTLFALPALGQMAAEPTPTAEPSPLAVALSREMTTSSGDVFGDDDGGPMSIRALLQTRYGQSWPTSVRPGERALVQANDGWQVERAFVRLSAKPTTWLTGKILLDFAALRSGNAIQTVKLAYAEIEPASRVKITAGLFKRSYSLLELLPIAEYEFADTGLADTLIQDTGFGGRDMGAMVAVQPLPKKKWLKLFVAAFQGGHIATDARPDGLLTARAESTPIKHLHLGADVAWRRAQTAPNILPVDGPQDAGVAWSADAMLQFDTWEVRAEMLGGDRTDVLHRANPDVGADAKTFLGAWLLGVYRIPVRTAVVMPALRLEWLDTDRDRPVGGHLLASGALNIDFGGRVRLLLDLTRQWVQDNTIPIGQKPTGATDLGTYMTFHDTAYWKFVTQLQVRL